MIEHGCSLLGCAADEDRGCEHGRLRGRRGALVPGLRRPRHPHRRPAPARGGAAAARADRLRVGDRLLEPLPALHEAPTASTASTVARCPSPRASSCAGPTWTCSSSWATATAARSAPAHWIHAIRYNVDMVAMMLDNNIYGLTKNQTSPTTPQGLAEQHAAARRVPAGPEPARRHARRHQRLVRGADGATGCRRTSSRRSRRRTATRASRSCASCSAARSTPTSCSRRRCATRDAIELLVHPDGIHDPDVERDLQEPPRPRPVRPRRRAPAGRGRRAAAPRPLLPQRAGARVRGDCAPSRPRPPRRRSGS